MMKPYKPAKRIMSKRITALFVGAAMTGCAAVYAKDSLYAQGQKQLDKKEWSQAQNSFSKMISEGSGKQDAALYWLAYSYHKGSKNQQALNAIDKLSSLYPQSQWVDDGLALQAEIKDDQGEAEDITSDEMKLYAIDSLMNSSGERAFQVLSKILQSNSSPKIKKRALFVLTQTGSKQGFDLVGELALKGTEPELQFDAIHMLGIAGNKNAREILSRVVAQGQSEEIKSKALHALMIAGDHAAIKKLASSDLGGKLQNKAIHLMGVMGQADDLLALYQDKKFTNNRIQIIEAMSISNGYQQLAKVIDVETDEKLRLKAIHRLGIMSAKKTGTLLNSIYHTSKTDKEKSAVIQALFIQSNAKALIKIAKQEKSQSLKRKAIKRLSMIDSDETVEFFSNILEQE